MFKISDLFKLPTREELIKTGHYFVIATCQITLVLLALCVYDSYHKTRIGVVNISGIADEFIKAQSGKGLSPAELKNRARFFGSSLEKILHDVGAKKRAVLMPAEAVITGAKDYTQEVQQQLSLIMQQEVKQEQPAQQTQAPTTQETTQPPQQVPVQDKQSLPPETNQAVIPSVVQQAQEQANQAMQPEAVQAASQPEPQINTVPTIDATNAAADIKKPEGK